MSTSPALQYYIVDEAGNIEFPVLGTLHVAGLKRTEAQAMIKQQLEKQVLNPQVQINLVDAKVSVLGEVNRPGTVEMRSGRMTILDALAAAGDMTVYGQRDNVLVTREINGKLEIARLNLRSADICTSPFYYLQQNDVVYVSPNKVRAVASTNASLWLGVVSTALSAATVIITVVK
jgi:polysaccharide export outer membrane protein